MAIYVSLIELILRTGALAMAIATVVVFVVLLRTRSQPRALYAYTLAACTVQALVRAAILWLSFQPPKVALEAADIIGPMNALGVIVLLFSVALTGVYRVVSARHIKADNVITKQDY